jgi:hypothetical protein
VQLGTYFDIEGRNTTLSDEMRAGAQGEQMAVT